MTEDLKSYTPPNGNRLVFGPCELARLGRLEGPEYPKLYVQYPRLNDKVDRLWNYLSPLYNATVQTGSESMAGQVRSLRTDVLRVMEGKFPRIVLSMRELNELYRLTNNGSWVNIAEPVLESPVSCRREIGIPAEVLLLNKARVLIGITGNYLLGRFTPKVEVPGEYILIPGGLTGQLDGLTTGQSIVFKNPTEEDIIALKELFVDGRETAAAIISAKCDAVVPYLIIKGPDGKLRLESQ